MSSENSNSPVGVCREDILKFPFPFKLWIVISLPTTFLTWNSDGTLIQVNLMRLQEYLHSTNSIFIIKTSTKFLEHLRDFQFTRVEDAGASGPVELCYKHENFQRHRLDLVGKVRRVTFFNLDNAQNAELEAAPTPPTPNPCADRMRGDLCFMEHGCLTEIQKKRVQSEIVFTFTRESRVLQEKLKKVEAKMSMNNICKRGRSACMEREQIVVLPKELYENPYDSILAGKGGFQGYRYGGYYGNCTVEQIESFFGDYLPKYGEGGILHVKNCKESSEENVLNENPIGETGGMDSAISAEDTDAASNKSAIVVKEGFLESDSFISNNSSEASNLTDASNINISASFNCDSGAMEYNITEFPSKPILKPAFETLTIVSADPKDGMNSPEEQTVVPAAPRRPAEENNDFYDDLRATFELLQNQQF